MLSKWGNGFKVEKRREWCQPFCAGDAKSWISFWVYRLKNVGQYYYGVRDNFSSLPYCFCVWHFFPMGWDETNSHHCKWAKVLFTSMGHHDAKTSVTLFSLERPGLALQNPSKIPCLIILCLFTAFILKIKKIWFVKESEKRGTPFEKREFENFWKRFCISPSHHSKFKPRVKKRCIIEVKKIMIYQSTNEKRLSTFTWITVSCYLNHNNSRGVIESTSTFSQSINFKIEAFFWSVFKCKDNPFGGRLGKSFAIILFDKKCTQTNQWRLAQLVRSLHCV